MNQVAVFLAELVMMSASISIHAMDATNTRPAILPASTVKRVFPITKTAWNVIPMDKNMMIDHYHPKHKNIPLCDVANSNLSSANHKLKERFF
jgi:hypothetical protein